MLQSYLKLAKGKRIVFVALLSWITANHRGSRKYKVSRLKAGRDNENFNAGSQPRKEIATKQSVLPMTVPEEVSWQKDLQGLGWLRPRGTGGCLVARETKGNKTKSPRRRVKKKVKKKRDNKKMRSCVARKRSRRWERGAVWWTEKREKRESKGGGRRDERPIKRKGKRERERERESKRGR